VSYIVDKKQQLIDQYLILAVIIITRIISVLYTVLVIAQRTCYCMVVSLK